jgi:DHA1 family 2-module integral membrane pump EmrD-like MFS transporter
VGKVEKKQPPVYFVVIIVIMLMASGFVAADLYLPSLPAISVDLHASHMLVQATLFLYLLGFSISQFISGTVSDRFGRKPILLIGISIYLLGSALSICWHSITGLIIARLIQGLGIGSCTSVGRVVLRDLYQGNRLLRVLSYLSGIIGLSLALAPALGGFLQHHFDYKGNLWFMLGYGVVLILLVLLLLPETNANKDVQATNPRRVASSIKDLFLHRSFVVHSLSAGGGVGVIIGFSAINPFLLESHLHLTAAHYGLLALLISVGMAISMFLTPRIRPYISSSILILSGYVLVALAGVALLIAASFAVMSVAVIVSTCLAAALGAGFIVPNSAIIALQAFPNKRGVMGSVYSCIMTFIASLVGFVVSFTHPISLFPLAFLFIGLGGLGVLLRFYFGRAECNQLVTNSR